jgi:hypothetical protein
MMMQPVENTDTGTGGLANDLSTTFATTAMRELGQKAQLTNLTFPTATVGLRFYLPRDGVSLKDQIFGEMESTALKVDTAVQSMVNRMGEGEGLGASLRENFAKAVSSVQEIGLDFVDVQKAAESTLDAFGRNVSLSEQEYTNLLSTNQVTGVGIDKLLDGFTNAGMSIKDITSEMNTVLDVSNAIGVNAKLVSAKVVENLDKLNKFGFQNGIEGLAKMAAKAQVLRIDMKEIFTLADTLMDPEGAIELASTLQRLGTTSAALTDPLRLMDMAQNDVGALTDELGKMFSQYAEFNEENQRFEILPGARLEIRELEKDLRLPAGTIEKMAIGTKDIEKKLSEISFSGFDIPQDTQELIANMSMMGESGEYMIKYVDEEGKTREETTAQFLEDFGNDVEGMKKALGKQKEIEGESADEKMYRRAGEQLTSLQAIQAQNNSAMSALGLAMGGGELGKQVLEVNEKVAKDLNSAIKENLGPNSDIAKSFNDLAKTNKDAMDVITGKQEGNATDQLKKVGDSVLGIIDKTLLAVGGTMTDIATNVTKSLGIDTSGLPSFDTLAESLGVSEQALSNFTTGLQNGTATVGTFISNLFSGVGGGTTPTVGQLGTTTPRASTTVTPVGTTTPPNPTAASPQITVTPTPATSIVTPPATATLSPTTIIEITQLQEILSKNIESENNNTTIISALNESLTTFNTANTENQTNVLNQLSEILTTNNTSVITLLNESLTTLNNTNTANQTNQTNILTQFSEIINKNITSEENNTNSINTLSSILVSLISITKGGIVEAGEKGTLINNFNTTQLPTDITAIEGTEKGGTVSPNNESLITYTQLISAIQELSTKIGEISSGVTTLNTGGFDMSKMMVGPAEAGLEGVMSDLSQFEPINRVLSTIVSTTQVTDKGISNEENVNNFNQNQTLQDVLNNFITNVSNLTQLQEILTNNIDSENKNTSVLEVLNNTLMSLVATTNNNNTQTNQLATDISNVNTQLSNDVKDVNNQVNQPTINVTEPLPNTDTTSIQPAVTNTPVMTGSFPELLRKPEEIKKEKSFNLTEVVPALKLISENNTNNSQEISNNFDTAVKTLITDNNQNSQSLITTVNSQNNFPELLKKPEENKPEKQFDVNDFTKVLRPTLDLKSESTKQENNLSSELASIKKPDVSERAKELSLKLSMLDEDKRLFTPIPEPKEGETGIRATEIETLTNTNETLQNFEKVITESNFGNEVPLSVAEFKGAEQMISQFANPDAVPAYATPPVEEIQKKSEDIKKVMTGSNNVNTDNINMDIKITGADTPEFNKFKDDLEQKIYAEVKRRTDDRIRTDSQFQRSINANTSDVNFGLLTSEIQSV